ncbi:MAG: alpha-2-macroglobulin, partial [Chloroflexota bacterium]|nr:alpha-2-macroglobulin [Chloroflexota bacterium]
MIDHERAGELAQLPSADLDPVDRDWLAQHVDGCDLCRGLMAGPGGDPGDAPADTGPARPPRTIHRRLVNRFVIAERFRRRAAVLVVAAVAIAIVGGSLAWNAAPSMDGTVARASNPTRAAAPGLSGADDSWASSGPSATFEAPTGIDHQPTATLTAQGAEGGVVPLNAGFRLASTDGTPASRLATRLTVEPNVVFTVDPDADDRAALITPAKPLLPGNVYRFTLSGSAGELLDTWAFQARQPLRVVQTIPQNQTADVPVDTGIEITFDQDGVTDATSHVSITPATKGRFEQHGRTLAFVPDRPLALATIYRVTVTSGVTVASTGEATTVDTRIQFETAGQTDPTALGR